MSAARHVVTIFVFIVCACQSGAPSARPGERWISLSYVPAWFGKTWEATIDRDGEVRIFVPDYSTTPPTKKLFASRNLRQAQLEALSKTVAASRFDHLQDRYVFPATDQDTLKISVNNASEKQVLVYGTRHLCTSSEVQSFLSVWRVAVRLIRPPNAKSLGYEDCGGV